MTRAADNMFGKLLIYVTAKWLIVIFTSAVVLIEAAAHALPPRIVAASLAALIAAGIMNLILHYAVLRRKDFPFPIFLTADLMVILLTLYFNGGLENTWMFLPGFVIFLSGYIFSMEIGLAHAAISVLFIFIMFILEYSRIIPHFNAYPTLFDVYWREPNFVRDCLFGKTLLYAVSAVVGGRFNQSVKNFTEQLEKSLDEETRCRIDLEGSHKKLESAMGALNDEMEKLKAVDRMKTEFLSIISHELKTPLTPIHEYASLLQEGILGELNEKQKEAVMTIGRQGGNLNDLIDNLLDVSLVEIGKPFAIKKEFISIPNLLFDVREAVVSDMQKSGLAYEEEIPADIPTIYADPRALKRLFLNLIGNSMKFTPKGGKIKISVGDGDNLINFCVADTGIGIAAEHIEKIFEKFYQVDSSYTREAGGIGMGLPIAREIVEAHGGKIWAESKGIGHGTRICFQIPLS